MLVVAALAVGAARSPHSSRSQTSVFSSKVVGVRVDALVVDAASGKPVGGLAAKDFELRDNGVVQTIDAFDSGDVPLNVILALDMSASIVGKTLFDLQSATHQLLAGLTPADRAALITFNQAVTPRVALTSDVGRVRAVVDALTPSGTTSLLDGIYVSLVATLAEPGRSFVLVFTDGRDTTSWLDPNEVLESARRSNAVIYIVASSGARRWAPLNDLADATGGHVIEIESSDRVAAEFEKIAGLPEPLRADVSTYGRRGRRLSPS